MVDASNILLRKIMKKVSDATVELRYVFCYKDEVEVFTSQIMKIMKVNDAVSMKAEEAKNEGKIIYDDLLMWQLEVKEFYSSAEVFLETYKSRSSWRCIQCLPVPNPISRFRLGREVVRKARMVSELTDCGKDLLANEIAFLPPVQFLPPSKKTDSRKHDYHKLWVGLVTEGSPLVHGIYGLPGVGKAQMAEQIGLEAIEKNIFNKVLRVDVGEVLDVIKLQNQIAGQLDCHFESQDDVEHRASQLESSFLNLGKILIIFVNVWHELPLHAIGIPWGDGSSSMGCKILMTSRSENVCLHNGCEHPVEITTLTAEEAWDLFKNTVGSSQIDNLQDESLAKAVCHKCQGHTHIIHAVGEALKNAPHQFWKDALKQLENSALQSQISPWIDPTIYTSLKLSIDKLEEDAKSCLFVCSLFPDDAEIHIRKLIQVATGLQLVPEGETRICAMVDKLRSSSLLLHCREIHEIKLHDLIRDVARFLSVQDPKYAFLIARCGSRLPDYYDFGTRKSVGLDLESDYVDFPDDLVCPDLRNLWLRCNKHIQQFSSGFFSMFVNLRFLLIEEGTFSSLEQQFSLRPLGKLRTLILDNCDMTNIDQANISFFPNNLETLCIWNCDLPVPLDLPNLKHLRKLEIYSKSAVVMVQESISRLSSLEELHIRNGVQFWDGSTVTAPLLVVEISKLTGLKSLHTFFSDSEPFQHTHIFGNLHEYDICVGKRGEDIRYLLQSSILVKRRIELFSNQLEALKDLIERAEEVKLLYCNDRNVSSIFSNNREAFVDLRNLYVEGCNTMEYLARISEDKIQHSHPRQTSFCTLTTLGIYGCSAMKYLFSKSVANCLMQLQELCIDNCRKMKEIVLYEATSDEGEIISFPQLKLLKLVGLPRLTSFYGHNYVQFQPLFDGMVVFPSLEELHIEDLEDTSDIWAKYDYQDDVSFSKLKRLKVSECNKLKIVIPRGMFRRLQNLESLSIDCCASVIAEVGTYGSNTDVLPLKALRAMELESLPCLTETKFNSREDSGTMTWYPNLEYLRIRYCNGLRNVFLPSTARELVHIKKMCIVGCKKMTEIIGVGKKEISAGITFPKMTDLELTRLPNLTSLWNQSKEHAEYKVELPKLVNFKKLNCDKLAWKR